VNAKHLGRNVFGGYRTLDAPVAANSAGSPPYLYNGDDGITRVPVNDTTAIEVSLTAREILNMDGAVDSSAPDALAVLVGLRDDLQSGNTSGIQGRIGNLEQASENVVALRGKMGARALQMDVHMDHLSATMTTLSEWLSQVEDVDIAETLMNLQTEQNVYQSALIAASHLSMPSLADFLK